MALMTPDGSILEQALKLGFKASNNEAKYVRRLARLQIMIELQINELSIYYDSMMTVI